MIIDTYIGDFTEEEKAEISLLSSKGMGKVVENEHMKLEFLCTNEDFKNKTVTVIAITTDNG